MLDHADPIIQSFLREGYKLSIQAHIQSGRSPRYTAIARTADGQRVQGWGGDAQEALRDMKGRRSPKPESE
jgi:hypothetical protein